MLIGLLASAALQAAPMLALGGDTPAETSRSRESGNDSGVGVAPGSLFVDRDTPIRLMVLNEVSSRTAKPGTRFVLRVDEPVVVDGVTVVPVGAKAWGEVLSAETSGAVGKAGRLHARLLHIDLGGTQIPITGENEAEGESGASEVALGVLTLGPLALFARGNNAKLKAGELFSAYFAGDLTFDRATAVLSPAPPR